MTPEQKAAFVTAQAACMLAELKGLQADNLIAIALHEIPPHGREAFEALPARYGLGHNDVLGFFHE